MKLLFLSEMLLLGSWIMSLNPAMAQTKDQSKPPQKVIKDKAPHAFKGLGVAFVADGSGEGQTLSENLREILQEVNMPFAVDTSPWSVQDQSAARNHRDVFLHTYAGAYMADRVKTFSKANPNRKVILIAHSAGAHVVLLAAANLPPKSVDRIILLGASVGCNYDLRPALKASKSGIDSFWSHEDSILQIAARLLGTADGQKWVPCAGRVGFSKPPPKTPGAELYKNLREYPYTHDLRRFNHHGGHMGYLRLEFLENLVLPMFTTFEEAPAPAKK